MDRIVYLSNLYKKSVNELTKSRGNWKGLLSRMARYYKYSFDNNVLIHTQRPDSGPLATLDIWNEKIGRSVNSGVKGLAVIDLSNPKASLKFLFDLLDTNGNYESFRRVMNLMWELENQYKTDIIIKMRDKYGMNNSSIESCIYELAEKHISENLPKYLKGFSVADPDSMLYGLPADAVKEQFIELTHDSIEYLIFKKCGLPTDTFEEDCFENISHFNSMWLFTRMGSIIMSIARPILRELHMEIENIKYGRGIQNEQRTFDRPDLLRRRGRTTVSQYSNIGGREIRSDGSGQIRQDVEGILGGTIPVQDNRVDNGRELQQDGDRGGRGGRETEGRTDTGASKSAAHAGHGRYVGESGPHEHDLSNGGRNNNPRSSIENKIAQYNPHESSKSLSGGFLRSGTDNAESESDVNENTAVQSEILLLSDTLYEEELSKVIDSFLLSDNVKPVCKEWRLEIHEFFIEADHPLPIKADLIKFSYYSYGKLDGKYIVDNGTEIHAKATDESIYFEVNGSKFTLSYTQLAEKIDNLILAGVYPISNENINSSGVIKDEEREINIQKEDGVEPGVKSEIEATAVGTISPSPSVTKEQIIEKVLLQGNITVGGKENMQNAVLSMETKKDRVSFIHKAYNYAGVASPLDNGGHFRWMANPKGIEIDYDDDALKFKETLPWNKVEALISDLVKRGEYLEPDIVKYKPISEPDKAKNDSRLKLEPFTVVKDEATRIFMPVYSSDQVSIHEGFAALLRAYQDTETADNDNIIDGNTIISDKTVDAAQSSEESSGSQIDTHTIQTAPKTNNNSHAIMDDLISSVNGNRLNYSYSPEHNLYTGGQKTKCRNNIEAIRLLQSLQSECRPATADEQIILAKFVGWGGLANALTPDKSGWEKEYAEIKSLLSKEEFKSAQESTATAFYTGQNIITHIYNALERFGFREGNILDPAMGTGNFFSVLPESMSKSQLYGVELDAITGGIAKQLYPDANIEVKGFEETNHPDHFFDVAVGNIPFNNFKVNDKRYDKHNFIIHDYFIAKTLDKVRGGGIIAFITSKFTLDKANSSSRKYISQKAELIGAIRLPDNAFKTVSGTKATTDIVFLQKREREIVPDEYNNPWIHIENNTDGVPVNSYFIAHPEMILGTMVFDQSMYANENTTACHPYENADLDKLLTIAVNSLNCQYHDPIMIFEDHEETIVQDSINADPNVKNYSYTLVDGILYYRENSRMYRQDVEGKKLERIKGLLEVRSALRGLIKFQTDFSHYNDDLPAMTFESEIQEYIGALNSKYDTFVKRYGFINSRANKAAFSKDSDAPLLRSIEKEKDKNIFEKTAVFYKATIKPKRVPKSVSNAEEALKMSLNIKGDIDLEYMQGLYRKDDYTTPSIDEIVAELGEHIYLDPAKYNGETRSAWVTAEEYLSGNVKNKLAKAIEMAEEKPEMFFRNAEALRQVQPAPLATQDISFTLGSTWIPVDVYEQYMYEKFQTYEQNKNGDKAIKLEYSSYTGIYHIRFKSIENDSILVNKAYGTERINAYEILEDTLNLKTVTVKDSVVFLIQKLGKKRKNTF